MTGKRLLKRLVSVILGMLGFFLFLHAVDADAMTAAVSSRQSAISQNEAFPQVIPPQIKTITPSRQLLRF